MNAEKFAFIDDEHLLFDISPEFPCGDDTRGDSSKSSPYFNLKDLRSQARALERQALAGEEVLQIPQWRQLAEQIPAILSERSKDLEFIAWYIEALCREHGFDGLAHGFDLARRTIQTHWNKLHPQPDEEGLTTRIAPLVGLNGSEVEGTLIQPILSVPLFLSSDTGSFATWRAEQAAEVNRLEDGKAQQRIKAGAASLDDLLQAVRETPRESLVQTHRAIDAAQTAFTALSDAMDAAMDGAPQPTSNIRRALERCKSVLMHYAGEQLERAQSLSEDAQPLHAALVDPRSDELPSNGDVDAVQVALQSRKQALDQLRRLADFFRHTEPHSPISYAISQAVRWSELPLPELMQELIADSGARQGFCRITGVPAPGLQD